MKKLVSALVLGFMLLGAVSLSNPEAVEASTVKSETTETVAEFQTTGYLPDGRPRPIDVY